MNPDQLLRQMMILKGSREQIEFQYRKAVLKGEGTNPTILLYDLTDQTARSLARTKGTTREINAIRRAAERSGSLPIATDALPHTEAMALIEVAFPDVVEAIKQQGDKGTYWAVVVAEGSALPVAMPPVELKADAPAPSRRSRGPSAN